MQIVNWFVRRWQIDITFQEVRTHLAVESQRQWSDLAIARSTPALLGLFSLITLMADRAAQRDILPVRRTASYAKPTPTFSVAIAVVRSQMWRHLCFQLSPDAVDVQ